MATATRHRTAINPFDPEALLRRLPAEARAQFTWALPRIEASARRLRNEELTDTLLAEVAREFVQPWLDVTMKAVRFLFANVDDLRAAFLEGFAEEEQDLAAQFSEEHAIDTVHRVFGFFRSLIALRSALDAFPANDVPLDSIALSPELAAYSSGAAALFAAVEETRERGSSARANELLDIAYLHLSRFARRVKDRLEISSAPEATVLERRSRLLADFVRLRSTLSEADWNRLEHARLRNLR